MHTNRIKLISRGGHERKTLGGEGNNKNPSKCERNQGLMLLLITY